MGTRFVSHRRRAFTRLLDMWPAIVIALENTLTAHKHKPDTRAKISGLVTQLRSYKLICLRFLKKTLYYQGNVPRLSEKLR